MSRDPKGAGWGTGSTPLPGFTAPTREFHPLALIVISFALATLFSAYAFARWRATSLVIGGAVGLAFFLLIRPFVRRLVLQADFGMTPDRRVCLIVGPLDVRRTLRDIRDARRTKRRVWLEASLLALATIAVLLPWSAYTTSVSEATGIGFLLGAWNGLCGAIVIRSARVALWRRRTRGEYLDHRVVGYLWALWSVDRGRAPGAEGVPLEELRASAERNARESREAADLARFQEKLEAFAVEGAGAGILGRLLRLVR